MKLIDLLGLAIPANFFLFWGVETLANRAGHGRAFPTVRGWSLVGIAFLLFGTAVSVSLPLWLPADWLAQHRLMDLTRLGLWGAPLTFLVVSLVSYGFHRLEHRSDILWRGLHQMHHAGERIDMPGWALGHPLEFFFFAAIAALVGVFVLGVDPLAAALAGVFGGVLNQFQHLNVDTPRWLGYVVMRPEQHCQHHEREVHARNYSGDIALWDQLFGSFFNPPRFEGQVGFGKSAVRSLPAMMIFADVNGERSAQQ